MGEFILRPGAGVRPSANENDATKAQATRHRRTRRERHMATPHRHTQQANAATAQHRAQSREAPTALDAATEGRIRPGRFGQAPCQAQHAEERVISAAGNTAGGRTADSTMVRDTASSAYEQG